MTNEQLRNEFKNLIWKTATDLVHGGKVSPVQFMDFMLGSLFYRFISENLTAHCNKLMLEAGVENPDYAAMKLKIVEDKKAKKQSASPFDNINF